MDSLVICDTNIIIAAYKGEDAIVDELKTIGVNNIAISAITASELIYGALDKSDLSNILRDIRHLPLLHVNEPISRLHIDLMQQFALSHNATIPDMLIAATALHHKLPLYTLNVKDFRYIDGLVLYQKVQ